MNMKQWIGVGSLCVSIFSTNVSAHEGCALHGQPVASAPVQPVAPLVPGDAAVKTAGATGVAVNIEKKGAVSTGTASQLVQDQQAGQRDLLSQVLEGKKDEIMKALSGMLHESMQRGEQQKKERQERQLNVLPEPLRTNLQRTLTAHSHVTVQLKLDVFLSVACRDLFDRIQKQIPDDASCKKDAITALEFLNRALVDGSFMNIVTVFQLSGNMQDPQRVLRQLFQGFFRPAGEQIAFTEQDIVAIRTKLEAVRQYAQEHSFETTGLFGFLATDLATFIQYLDWAVQKDVRSLSTACIAKVSPLLDECLANIKAMVAALADKRLQVKQETELELAEALDAWIAQLKAYIQTLVAFRRVVTISGIDLSYVMQSLSYAYEIAEGFFRYNRNYISFWDPARVWNTSTLIDVGMRCVMLGLTGVHRVGEVASGEVQKCVLGTGSLASFTNPFDDPTYAMMLLMHSTPVLMHPSQERLTVVQRGFFRISAVLLINYFQQVNAQWQKASPTTKERVLPNILWPNDEWLKKALIITVKELQWFVANEAVARVKCDNHPRDGKPCEHCIMLEKLEKYSLGIVKPDLIYVASELLATMALFNSGTDAVLGHITDAGADAYVWNYATNGYADYWTFPLAYDSAQLPTKDKRIEFYLQYQLVRYLFESVGAFCGKNIVHNTVYGVVSGVAKDIGSLLAEAGKFIFDVSNEDEQEIVSQYQQYVTMLKTGLRSLFNEQSPERVMMVGLLKNMRLLPEDNDDPKKVNFSIIALVLYYLSQYNLITHVQEAQLYADYLKNPNDVMKFLDIVFDTIDRNKASITGGIVGGLVGNVLAAFVMKNYVAPRLAAT